MDIARPFIRLPLLFDAEKLAEEVYALADSAWMTHPSRLSGNSGVALISRDGGDNDDFDGSMAESQHLQTCPYIRQVMASFGEVFGRSRLMKLAAGAEVSPHVDFNYHWYTRVRIHIPVITNPQVTFYCADENIHMKAGECWIFNSWQQHRVTNEGAEDRVHLVIDTAGSSRFWKMVRDVGKRDSLVESLTFDADKNVEIRVEKYNIAPVMSPGEVDALVHELIHDFESNPDNEATLVENYRTLLVDFTNDWRETWHLYGYQREGWQMYQDAIDKVSGQLHPNNRALVTQSNDIGVNPIIVQRILRAALAVDKMRQFIG